MERLRRCLERDDKEQDRDRRGNWLLHARGQSQRLGALALRVRRIIAHGALKSSPELFGVITAVITNASPYASRPSAAAEISLHMEHTVDLITRPTRLRALSGVYRVEVRLLSGA
jgi:hypothetical protein